MKTDTHGYLATSVKAASAEPYIYMVFTSADGLTTYNYSTDQLSNRVIAIEHHEELYNDYATVVLRTEPVGGSPIASLLGYWVEIGYGYVNGYTGEGDQYCKTPRLWVKSQQQISRPGVLISVLELEGMWAGLGEWLLRIGTEANFYRKEYTATTVYSIMADILDELGWTIDAVGTQDDSIISTYTPEFVASQTIESAAECMFRLISMTKGYLRPKTGLAFKFMYPQSSDSTDIAYKSVTDASYPTFYTYTERASLTLPNHILTFANAGVDGAWSDYKVGEDNTTAAASIAAYKNIYKITFAANIATEATADIRATVYAIRAAQEQVKGKMVAPHDCRLELLDRIVIIDTRLNNNYPADTLARVCGIVHIYDNSKGQYDMEVTLGGITTDWSGQTSYIQTTISGASREYQAMKQIDLRNRINELQGIAPTVEISPAPKMSIDWGSVVKMLKVPEAKEETAISKGVSGASELTKRIFRNTLGRILK